MAHSTTLIFCLLLVTLTTLVLAEETMSDGIKEVADKDEHTKVKRDGGGLTSQQKTTILNMHNDMRRKQKSSNMLNLDWSPEAERTAQNWADQCLYVNSPLTSRPSIPSSTTGGENLYFTTGSFDVAKAVQEWYNQISYYSYSKGSCSGIAQCTKYTQLVWSKTRVVGCALKNCDNIPNWGKGSILVCHYGPGGNTPGVKPYKLGAGCSECPEGKRIV